MRRRTIVWGVVLVLILIAGMWFVDARNRNEQVYRDTFNVLGTQGSAAQTQGAATFFTEQTLTAEHP